MQVAIQIGIYLSLTFYYMIITYGFVFTLGSAAYTSLSVSYHYVVLDDNVDLFWIVIAACLAPFFWIIVLAIIFIF